MRRVISILVVFIFTVTATVAQNEKKLDSLIRTADSLYRSEGFAAALETNLAAVDLTRKFKENSYFQVMSPVVMLNTGKCYKELSNFKEAHRYMTYSLQLARANKYQTDIQAAFSELNLLHKFISSNNLAFDYPEVTVTEEAAVFYSISKVERISADSVRLIINGGKLDGITDSVKKGGIISRFEQNNRNRPFALVNCYIREVNDDYCVAYARNDSVLYVKEGDIVELKTRLPLFWRKLDVGDLLMRAISFRDNFSQPVFNYRYLYYYADSNTNNDIAAISKNLVDEVVAMLAEDTAKGDFVNVKGEKGIFAGDNVMRAMSRSKPEHLRLFLSFVSAYPRTYLGTSFKFSEMFATWVINNTPLAIKDVMPWLVNIRDRQARKRMAVNLSATITENELVNKWFNDGMLMANSDNIDSSLYIAELIQDVTLALEEKAAEGWADYLFGYTYKKLGENSKAESHFKNALSTFREKKNNEGITWASNALKNLQLAGKVSINVQTGNVFQYLMAFSPNSKYIATAGSYDRILKVWDLRAGRTIASFTAHQLEINSVQYSPNGRYIVTSSEDSTIKVWNAYDFSLLYTIKRPVPESEVIFSPDSKQLVAGGRDSLIKFIDIHTGKILKTLKKHKGTITSLCFMPNDSDYLFSGGADSLVYKWDLTKNDWDHWYSGKGKVMDVSVSNDGKYLSFVSSDTLIRVWKLENNKFYFNIRPNHSKSDPVDIAFPCFMPDSKFMALALRDDTLAIIELSTLKEQVYGFKMEKFQGLYDMIFSPDGATLATRMSLGGPLRLFNFSGWDFSTNATVNTKDLKNYANLPLSVQFTPDDNELVIVHDAISKIDLRNGATTFLYNESLYFLNNNILLNDGKTGLYNDLVKPGLKLYDIQARQVKLTLSLPDKKEELRRFELSADNKLIFIGGANNTIAGFSLPGGEQLFSAKYELGGPTSLIFLRYDSIRRRLYAIGKNSEILVINPQTGILTASILPNFPQSIEVTPEFLYVTCDSGLVFKYDAASLRLLKKIPVHESKNYCYGSVMSWDHKYLVVQVADKFVTLDTRTDKVLYERFDHEYENGIMSISHDNKMLATGGFDSKVNLYELSSGKLLSSIYTPRGKDFMLVNAEGYYLSPKNTLEAVSFGYNNSTYGFEQFDVKYNRPDLVLKEIGRADTNLINLFSQAWQKRLSKLKIQEADAGTEVHLPVVRMKDKFAIKPGTSLEQFTITVECYDAKYPLQSLQVMVNNNSLFGSSGKLIPGKVNRVEVEVKIPLSTGNNKLKIYCTNNKGVTSLAENLEINSTYKPAEKMKTYFIGMAVSNYRDSSMNLRYAAKDVRDLASFFSGLIKNCEVDTLIDEKVTRENIISLRQKLMNTTVNDKVIISVNGHGLLSDSLDFYFATHDVDFDKPQERGLKYEELEALLDGIPARKKLLLIDACHSGALDKEEILARQKDKQIMLTDTSADKGIITGVAARGIIIDRQQNVIDANSSYEVMQNLFADISSGNGAVIISAAGGMEYAFESDKWNNGVFTYCIRKGIEEDLADKDGGNNDKLVSVSELKNYVSRKVSELTGGLQKPVSRKENIEYDWIVW
jgi:WD40 repeat protein